MSRELQQELDEARFRLNQWEAQNTIEVEAASYGKNPETGELTLAVIFIVDKPILLIPGMRLTLVPKE